MSREIKFRAWDGEKLIPQEHLYWDGQRFVAGTWGYEEQFISHDNQVDVELMQYTGLKDKNGVEIYEGDIVVWCINNVERVGEIYYTGQLFDMRNDATSYGCIGWDALRGETEVIGNIHQNPELLERLND